MQWLLGKPRGRSLAEDNHLLRELLAKEHTERLRAQHRTEELEQQLYSAAHAAEQLGESLCIYLAPEPLVPATCPGKLSLLPGSTHDAPLSSPLHAADALRSTADTSKQQKAAGCVALDTFSAAGYTPGPAAAQRQQKELQLKLKGLAAAWKQRLETYYDAGRLDQAEPLPSLAAAAARQAAEQGAAAAAAQEGGASSNRSSGGGDVGRHQLLAYAAAAAAAPAAITEDGQAGDGGLHSGCSRRGRGSPGPVRNLSHQLDAEGAAVAAAAAVARGPSLRSSDQDCYDAYHRDTLGHPIRPGAAAATAAGGGDGSHAAAFQHHLHLNLQAPGGYGRLGPHAPHLQHAVGGHQQEEVEEEEVLEGRPLLGGPFRHHSMSTSAVLMRPQLPSFLCAPPNQQPHHQQQPHQQQQREGVQANWGGPLVPQSLEDWQPLHNALRTQSSVRSIHSMRSSMQCLGDTTPLELLLQHQQKQAALARGALQGLHHTQHQQHQHQQQHQLVAQHSCTRVAPVAVAATEHSAARGLGEGCLAGPQLSMQEVPYYYLAPTAAAAAGVGRVAAGGMGSQGAPQPAPGPHINDDTDCMLCNSSAGSTQSSSDAGSSSGMDHSRGA